MTDEEIIRQQLEENELWLPKPDEDTHDVIEEAMNAALRVLHAHWVDCIGGGIHGEELKKAVRSDIDSMGWAKVPRRSRQ